MTPQKFNLKNVINKAKCTGNFTYLFNILIRNIFLIFDPIVSKFCQELQTSMKLFLGTSSNAMQ